MPMRITDVELNGSVLYARFVTHSYDVFNIKVDFREKQVWYKDGQTFNGNWHRVPPRILEKGSEEDANSKV